jgi:hypothetical protein
MGRKPIVYAGQCHRRVVSAEHFVRCTFPLRGMLLSPRNAAALQFARELVAKRGRATDGDVETDGEIAEIIAHVALNIFTNYFNNTAEVEVDFPKISLRRSA